MCYGSLSSGEVLRVAGPHLPCVAAIVPALDDANTGPHDSVHTAECGQILIGASLHGHQIRGCSRP